MRSAVTNPNLREPHPYSCPSAFLRLTHHLKTLVSSKGLWYYLWNAGLWKQKNRNLVSVADSRVLSIKRMEVERVEEVRTSAWARRSGFDKRRWVISSARWGNAWRSKMAWNRNRYRNIHPSGHIIRNTALLLTLFFSQNSLDSSQHGFHTALESPLGDCWCDCGAKLLLSSCTAMLRNFQSVPRPGDSLMGSDPVAVGALLTHCHVVTEPAGEDLCFGKRGHVVDNII